MKHLLWSGHNTPGHIKSVLQFVQQLRSFPFTNEKANAQRS